MLKRISAILIITLMLTMLPEILLAADANRFNSIVTVDRVSFEADDADMATFSVYLSDSSNQTASNQKVYVASNRGGTVDKFYAADGITPLTATSQNNVYETAVTTNGMVEFKVKSRIPGTARIAVGIVNPTGNASSVYQYLNESTAATAQSVGLINIKEIQFTNTSVDEIDVAGSPVPKEGTISGSGTKASPYLANTAGAAPEVNGNGVDYFEVDFKVIGSYGAPIADAEVIFTTDFPQILLSKKSVLTDAGGIATVKVYAEKSGTYLLKATAGSKFKEIYFTFAGNYPADWEMSTMKIDDVVATGTDKPDKQYFKLYDSGGSLINPANVEIQNVISFEWVKQPEGSTLENDWAFDGLSPAGKLQTELSSSNQHMYYSGDYVVVALPKLQKKGDYILKMSMIAGKSVNFSFKGGDFGEVTKITLYYKKTLPLNAVSVYPKVYRYNAEGQYESVSSSAFGSEILFSVSDYNKLNPNKTDLNSLKGKLYTTADRENKGKVTVTALDTVNKKYATYEIEIADMISGIKISDLDGNIPINKETEAKVKFVDVNGKETYPGDLKTAAFNYLITKKPEGAKAYIKEGSSTLSNLEDYNYGKFNIFCDMPGEVTFSIILETEKYKNDGTVEKFTLHEEKTVLFISKEILGAKKFVMFIGQKGYYSDNKIKTMDAAPFIKGNRAYVPLRAVANELETATEWDENTQTITLKREDRTVTMTIGSNLVKVGDSSPFTADGEPVMIDGCAYLPSRIIEEAFGVKVDPVLDSNDSVIGIEFITIAQ